MIRSLNTSTETFLDSLSKISHRMDRAQQQIATGKKLSNVSDDPDQVSALLQARADQESNKTVTANLGRVKTEVDAAEQAMQSAVTIVERVRTLAAQGANGTATAESRQSLAAEIGSLLEQLVGLAGTTVEGRYIFSGDNDRTPPYSIDLASTTPVSAYSGAGATRQIQHPNGTRFSVARTARDIFDSPNAGENVFFSLNTMRTALTSNSDAAIQSAMGDVATALTHLNGELSYYGTVQNKVAEATDNAQQRDLRLAAHISTLQDADLAEAITELQQASTQQQVTFQSRALAPPRSLFDYLG